MIKDSMEITRDPVVAVFAASVIGASFDAPSKVNLSVAFISVTAGEKMKERRR